ncbi:hypothetical protein M3Y97_00717500 [Aphelenchoides bicaudatus]|nr:hypothetical protein M3Y97_00717500 [Aphelenchoides bicaudatus]
MPPKRKTRKRRRASSEDDNRNAIAKKLQDRYGKKSSVPERTTAVICKSDHAILNPTKHDATVNRYVQNYLNKLNTPEEPKKFISRKWVCAFCGQQSCYSELGDLFGPYYVTGVMFPDFLPLTESKSASSKAKPTFSPDDAEVYSDVWFHGSCALWTPNLMFFAGKFPRLAEIVQTCWHQKCKICKKPGASIPIESQTGHIHFPCAVNKHYRLEELTLRCRPPLHSSAHSSSNVH